MKVTSEEKQQLSAVIAEAVLEFCKSGLRFKSSVAVQGLVGVTLDEHDVMLVDFKKDFARTTSSATELCVDSEITESVVNTVNIMDTEYEVTISDGNQHFDASQYSTPTAVLTVIASQAEETENTQDEDHHLLPIDQGTDVQCSPEADDFPWDVVISSALQESTVEMKPAEQQGNIIKTETTDEVIAEVFDESTNIPDKMSDKDFPFVLIKGKKTYLCPFSGCSYRSTNRSNAKRHTRQTHSDSLHSCDQCQKTFKIYSNLKEHYKAAHEGKKLMCEHCGKEFNTKTGLHSHVKREHGDEKDLLYQCEICGIGFVNKSHYIGHKNKHTNSKPYSCSVCDRKFAYSSTCVVHQKTCGKTPENWPAQCDICQMKFRNNSALAEHMNKHGTDMFPCEKCGTRFRWRTSLARHKHSCPVGLQD